MKKINKNFIIKRMLPVIAGAGLGYAYYHFIGCNAGHCPITSSPYISTVYGAVMGALLAIPSKIKNDSNEEDQ